MQQKIKDSLGAFLLGAASGLAVNIWFALFSITESSEAYSQVAEKQFALPLITGFLVYGIVAPILEELIFRWFLYRKIRQYYGITAGLILSSVLFGAYHGNLVQGLYGTLLGFLIAWMYEKCGSFLVPVLVHGGANVAVYLTVSLPEIEEKVFTYPGGILLTLLAFLLYFIFFTRGFHLHKA